MRRRWGKEDLVGVGRGDEEGWCQSALHPAAPKAEFQPTTSWKFIPVYIIACVSDGLSVWDFEVFHLHMKLDFFFPVEYSHGNL